jgi:hypothetical protein
MSNDESLKETGRCAAASIVEMVAALECDYERLGELREERDNYEPVDPPVRDRVDPAYRMLGSWAQENEGLAEELSELEEAAGECTSREDAEERIREDALSVQVRSDWYAPGEQTGANIPAEFEILLSTGGPASRIRGELDNGEPSRAWLEVQDWGTPWTQVFDIEQDTLLA